jgi:ABC-type Fe3+-hydroxamate transport system substrate-binding protein
MQITDQTGYRTQLTKEPQRIVSLVPSQTELLYDLGLEDRVLGVTRFCTRPGHWKEQKVCIGGTKDLQIERILELKPDLILANKEENERGQIEALRAVAPVYTSNISILGEAIDFISATGKITGASERAENLNQQIRAEFDSLQAQVGSMTIKPSSVLYLIWRKPWMAAGSDTFISDMLRRCGMAPVVHESRYPILNRLQDFSDTTDLVLLSSEPYPFKSRHLEEVSALLPNSRIELVDGEPFSWYGSRLASAPEYFRTLLLKLQS